MTDRMAGPLTLRIPAGVSRRPSTTEPPEVNRLQATLLALCLWPALALAQTDQEWGSTSRAATTPTSPKNSSPKTHRDPPTAEPPPTPSAATTATPAARAATPDRAHGHHPGGPGQERPAQGVPQEGPLRAHPAGERLDQRPVLLEVGRARCAAPTTSPTRWRSPLRALRRCRCSPRTTCAPPSATFQSRIFYSVPQWSAMGDVEWSPLYGKVAFFNSILHFDGYLLGGAGRGEHRDLRAARATTSTPRADLGVGHALRGQGLPGGERRAHQHPLRGSARWAPARAPSRTS